jgi:hypothetical protein
VKWFFFILHFTFFLIFKKEESLFARVKKQLYPCSMSQVLGVIMWVGFCLHDCVLCGFDLVTYCLVLFHRQYVF